MVDLVQWSATILGIIAAIMVAGKFSARITGWGFVIFAVSSIGWIAFGLIKQEPPLTLQNGVLLIVNMVGVWRHLIAKDATA
ncbi:MAG: hypothetical protein EON93_06795 [Burkholderiales bacterium]|nr:MAG: hypothetical protein EON93_06795 [Burkholderiales bacterium]